jgi:hypothetical protein
MRNSLFYWILSMWFEDVTIDGQLEPRFEEEW